MGRGSASHPVPRDCPHWQQILRFRIGMTSCTVFKSTCGAGHATSAICSICSIGPFCFDLVIIPTPVDCGAPLVVGAQFSRPPFLRPEHILGFSGYDRSEEWARSPPSDPELGELQCDTPVPSAPGTWVPILVRSWSWQSRLDNHAHSLVGPILNLPLAQHPQVPAPQGETAQASPEREDDGLWYSPRIE